MDKKKAYVVATAHLDTVWKWSLADTIEKFIPDTLDKNFRLIKKYPNYRFNFEGAYRYELIEEFYPKAFEKLKKHIKKDKWCISGSGYENGDVNIPSPEALFRNILIGNNYFKEKFGKKSSDLYLPDCFGFGWALPTIINHAGLKGLTTQKLTWGSAYGIPFDLGIWKGPDGSKAYVSLNPKSYITEFSGDIRADIGVIEQIADNANRANLPWSNHLYGVGDQGGSPTPESVIAVNDSINENKYNRDFEVISASTDQIFEELDKLTDEQKANLPVWDNELIMTTHGTGCYTSRTTSKRLNSSCEQFAFATESACCFAHYLGLNRYPKKNINSAWKKTIRHQFHDDLTGTSNMEVYQDSWNDYYVALYQLRNELLGATRSITCEMDTAWCEDEDTVASIVAYNPTQYHRVETVSCEVRCRRNAANIRAYDKSGKEVPCQLSYKTGKTIVIYIQVDVKPFSYKTYKIQKASALSNLDTGLKISNHSLENFKYKVRLNKNGDIAYIYDKQLNKQLLKSPIKLALFADNSSLSYPAWEINKKDLDKAPYEYANSPEFTILDEGPAKIALKVRRKIGNSSIVQGISLTPTSEYVEITNNLDWNERRTLLKAVFPFNATNQKATYDLGIGVIKRGSNTENLYEVPAQKWADLTDESGEYGVSVLVEDKYGWDKPDDNTLRLSCVHTPLGACTKETRQDLMDVGRNYFRFAIYSHSDGFENGTQKQAAMYNNTVKLFSTIEYSEGKLAEEISMLSVSDDDVIVRAVKMCEDDDSMIIRVNESRGQKHNRVSLKLFKEIESVQAVNASEEYISDIKSYKQSFVFNIKPFEVKTFKVKFKGIGNPKMNYKFQYMDIPYNVKGFTTDDNMRNVIIQGSGISLPLELIKPKVTVGGINFKLPKDNDAEFDVLACRGQEFEIPEGTDYIYFLIGNTLKTEIDKFMVDHKMTRFTSRKITEPLNTWDMYGLGTTAKIDQHNYIGYEFTHTHHPEGNQTQKAYFYLFELYVRNKKKLVLPDNNRIIILAMTAVKNYNSVKLVSHLTNSASQHYQFREPPIANKILDKTNSISIETVNTASNIISKFDKGIEKGNKIADKIRSYTKK